MSIFFRMAATVGTERTTNLVSWMSTEFLAWRNNAKYPGRTVVPIGVNDISWVLSPFFENSCICICSACQTPMTISLSSSLTQQFPIIVRHFAETRTCSVSKAFNQPKRSKSSNIRLTPDRVLSDSPAMPMVSPVASPSASPVARARSLSSRNVKFICM